MKTLKETILCAIVGALVAAMAYFGLCLSVPC